MNSKTSHESCELWEAFHVPSPERPHLGSLWGPDGRDSCLDQATTRSPNGQDSELEGGSRQPKTTRTETVPRSTPASIQRSIIWRTVWRFLRRLKIELPYDRKSLFWGIYPREMKSVPQRDTRTPVFTAA